jgi:hypothetical protein
MWSCGMLNELPELEGTEVANSSIPCRSSRRPRLCISSIGVLGMAAVGDRGRQFPVAPPQGGLWVREICRGDVASTQLHRKLGAP